MTADSVRGAGGTAGRSGQVSRLGGGTIRTVWISTATGCSLHSPQPVKAPLNDRASNTVVRRIFRLLDEGRSFRGPGSRAFRLAHQGGPGAFLFGLIAVEGFDRAGVDLGQPLDGHDGQVPLGPELADIEICAAERRGDHGGPRHLDPEAAPKHAGETARPAKQT